MKSGIQFIEELKQLRPLIYFRGKKVEDILNHPVLQPVINAAKATYDLALDPENEQRMLTVSALTGKPYNLLGALFQTQDDLVNSVKLRRWWQNRTGTCTAGRCAGICAVNALYNGTYVVDQECNTKYHMRFKEFFLKLQKEDKMCAAGVMCVKGDRSKAPRDQQDPDLHLRIVDQNSRGITVRGAKAHQTNGALAHEILVMPYRPLDKNEKDYAVSFAVPNGTEGLIHIWQYNLHDSRRLLDQDIDLGNKRFGLEYHGTCLTIFNDVFIPWESVFLCGETQYAQIYVNKFADLIRMCGGGCRSGAVDLAIGAMALLAEYNGVGEASHIVAKLTDLAHMNETGFGSALAAAYEGETASSGLCLPNSLYANVARLNGSLAFAESSKLMGDIAGGLIATSPSEMDFTSSEIGSLLNKYLQGKADVSTEHRLRALRFAEMIGCGPALHGMQCGGGTPETQKLVIRRNLKLEKKKQMVKKLAGIRA